MFCRGPVLLYSLVILFVLEKSEVVGQLTSQLKESSPVTASERFLARNLYQRLSLANDGGNLVLSPLSMYLLLAVLTEGAAGAARNQLLKILGRDEGSIHIQSVRDHIALMLTNKESSIQLVNRIFVDRSFPLNKDFLSVSKDYYHVEVIGIDLTNKIEAARVINSYVMGNTNHTIRDIIAEGDLLEDSSMVCVSTIHVRDSWAFPFPKRSTSKQSFHVSPQESISVEMMQMKNELHFLWDGTLKAKILSLDLISRGLKMVIFLPDEDLYDLEVTLSSLDIISLLKEVHSSHPMMVDVQLPTFRIQGDFDLEKTFKQMGLSGLFSPNAELTGISCCGGLTLTSVRQKTYIVLEENGVEASAATAAVGKNREDIRLVHQFHANRPFAFYLLMDDLIVFQGRVVNPST